ncbi:MAG: hypothetical protein ABI397_00140 [Candidatus Saccharimonas sp.]
MTNIVDVVSSTHAVVEVQKRVKICLRVSVDVIFLDFDLRLTNRGTDFKVYCNTGYQENTGDTDLLVSVLNALMTPRSGVNDANVSGYLLTMHKSAAVTTKMITERVIDAAHRAGYMVETVDAV